MTTPDPRPCEVCGEPLIGRARKYHAWCQKGARRASWVLKTYGLTLAEWDTIWQAQGERCAICQRAPKDGETFHLDHEHSNGQAGAVRGILCPYCNTRLVGRLRDHDKAQRLADYLREPPAPRALGRQVIAPGRPKRPRQPRRRTSSRRTR